jgi:hypothetical protein
MKFYVSGPVVESLNDKTASAYVYSFLKEYLAGHFVELPMRSPKINDLSPSAFFKETFERIKSCDAMFAFLTEGDQSGPVEAAIAYHLHKPLCVVEMGGRAPRLIGGLPNTTVIIKLAPGEIAPQLVQIVRDFGKSLQTKLP